MNIAATAMHSSGCAVTGYGVTISQRLLKANDEFEPPKEKEYNPVKNENDKLWGYFEEFRDYVYLGDSVNLRRIIRACPKFTTYFDEFDRDLHAMMTLYNQLIEHARLGEHADIVKIYEFNPILTSVIHSFVGNIDIKKQLDGIRYFAKKKDKKNLMQYIRGHAEILSTVSRRYEEIRCSSARGDRVNEFQELLTKIKEGDNVEIRVYRRVDPHLVSDIADIIECDRLVNFDVMLKCASEGNSLYMKYLVKKHPHLINYVNEQGECVLLNAVKSQRLSAVRVLAECDFGISDLNGRTALHHSCKGAMRPIVEYLVRNGAPANVQDRNGNTPLHYLCSATKPSLTLIKILTSHGCARIDICNNNDVTCLDILRSRGHENLEKYVKSHHSKEIMKSPEKIKNERERNKDIICRKHLSYSCPCSMAKRHNSAH